MEIKDMNLEDVTKRLADLDEEVRQSQDIEFVTKATSEKKELLERQAVLFDLEERKKTALEITAGKIAPPVKEERKDNKMDFDKMTRNELVASPEYRSAWLKNLQGAKLTEVEQRAYASTDTVNAIPEPIADKFFEKLKKLAPMLNEITLLRVAGNLKFKAEGTNNAATAKHTENTTVSPAADTIIEVSLAGYEFIKVITVSKTVATMSVNAFEDWLIGMLARDIARAVDNYIINDTTNGIVVVTTWTSNTNQILNTAGPTYANILSLIALLPAGYDPNAKFLMNKATLWGKVASIVDSSGQPILLKDVVNGPGSKILGYPVIVDDYVTTANGAIYLGDYATVVGNMPQDITVDKSTESGFRENSIDYRGTAIFDSKPANKDAIVRFVTTV